MKPIRVAFSGSGFKFPAHVGALLAIQDAGYTPVEMAGTSGGSIVAALAACGMSPQDMRVLTLSRDWSDMLTFSPWALLTSMGYCSGSNLLEWLKDQTHGRTFADLDVDLVIVASDVTSEQPFVFSKSTTPNTLVAVAARASASIPYVYAPVVLGPAMLMDGGMVDNIPVGRLAVDEVPRLGVQLVSKAVPFGPGGHSILDITPRILDLMLSANENVHVDLALSQGARFAFVETGYAAGLDRNMATEIRQRLLADGYAATRAALSCSPDDGLGLKG